MADRKLELVNGSNYKEHMERHVFDTVCATLKITDDIKRKAWLCLNAYLENSCTKQENDHCLIICFLYICVVDHSVPPYGLFDPHQITHNGEQPCVTLQQLLDYFSISIQQFFEDVKKLTDFYSEKVKQHLENTKTKYLLIFVLHKKFDTMTNTMFNETPTQLASRSQSPQSNTVEYVKSLAWTLFVYSKSQLFPKCIDLVQGMHLLLCVFDYIIRNTPKPLLNHPYDSLCDEQLSSMSVMRNLCMNYRCGFDEVKSLLDDSVDAFLLNLPVTDGEVNLEAITQLYIDSYLRLADINEIEFLYNNNTLCVTTTIQRTPPSVKDRTAKLVAPMTPVRAALNSVQQLRMLLDGISPDCSTIIEPYCPFCSTADLLSTIQSLLQTHKAQYIDAFTKSTSCTQRGFANMRFTLAMQLYSKVLQNILHEEEKRISKSEISVLLRRKVFHTCLLSCAVEVVTKIYTGEGSNVMLFPWILTVFDLQAYDFWKVIETFIKVEPDLPKDVLPHLQTIEHQILESMAWTEGSPVFELLDSPGLTHGDINALGNVQHLANVFASPGKKAPNKRSEARTIFMNKVLRLAHQRVNTWNKNLNVPLDLQQKIWTCVEYAVTEKYELLKNRHLDQVLMCCIYVLCKILDMDLKFKAIANMYNKLSYTHSKVCRYVHIREGYVDTIIEFYNQVFAAALKAFVFKFINKDSMVPMSPPPKAMPSPNRNQKYQILGHENITISPMKSPLAMTPRMRTLYNFGERSTEKLKNINEAMKTVESPRSASKSQKRLQFDDMSSSSVTSPSKRQKSSAASRSLNL